MDVAFFQLKRAFQSSVNFARPILARYGLTPARFDVLYAIHRSGTGANIMQCALVRVLGVKSSTTSRMVSSLEKLGLVWREKFWGDKRIKTIWLSLAGRELLMNVLRDMVDTGAARFAVHRAVVARWWSARARRLEGKRFAMFLLQIREVFGDTGFLDHGWLPMPPPKRRRARYLHVGNRPPETPPWMLRQREEALRAWSY